MLAASSAFWRPRQDRLPHDVADARAAHPPRKANSNICTSQVLANNMAGTLPITASEGCDDRRPDPPPAAILAEGLEASCHRCQPGAVLLTPCVSRPAGGCAPEAVLSAAQHAGYNLRQASFQRPGAWPCGRETTADDVAALLRLTPSMPKLNARRCSWTPTSSPTTRLKHCCATTPSPTHPVFNSHHTEHAMLRYLKSCRTAIQGWITSDDRTDLTIDRI